MFVAYTAKIHGIIESWQYYQVCGDYNDVVSKILGDAWVDPRILSVQSLEAHQCTSLQLDTLASGLVCNFKQENIPWIDSILSELSCMQGIES